MSKELIKKHALTIQRMSNVPGPVDPNFFKQVDNMLGQKIQRRLRDEKITLISPRNLSLIRNSIIVLIRGEPHFKALNMGTYIIPAKKLTPEEIAEHLADYAEEDRIYKDYNGEAPFWELEGITREQFMARKEAERAAFKASPRGRALEAHSKKLGRSLNDRDVWNVDKTLATPERRKQMEWEERTGRVRFVHGKEGEWKVRDRYVNAILATGICLYTFYYYPASLYVVMGIIALMYFLAWFVAYTRIMVRAASEKFVPDPKSRYSEAYQFDVWLKDRIAYVKKQEAKEQAEKEREFFGKS